MIEQNMLPGWLKDYTPTMKWHFIEEALMPENGEVYLVRLRDGVYSLVECKGASAGRIEWLSIPHDNHNEKFDNSVAEWCEMDMGKISYIMTCYMQSSRGR